MGLTGELDSSQTRFICLSAELIYGEPFTVSRSFVMTNTIPWSPVEKLRLPNAIPTSSRHSNMKVSTTDENFYQQNMYSRDMMVKRPYDGPYEVILPGSKTFRIRVGDREEIIAIDHLKQPILTQIPQ